MTGRMHPGSPGRLPEFDSWVHKRALALQAQGPDEFPFGYYVAQAEYELTQSIDIGAHADYHGVLPEQVIDGCSLGDECTFRPDEATTEAVPCVCGAQLTRPYPNDTGHHSTTECIDEAADEATTDLTAVLAAHPPKCSGAARDGCGPLYCPPCSEAANDWVEWTPTHLADALAPVIRSERAAALVRASAAFLRWATSAGMNSRAVARWLTARAEAERRGDS